VGLILRTSNKFICINCIERELREQGVCRVPLTLGKALKSLNKGFAECHPRQTWHNNQSDGKELSADCYFLGIRQRLCRVLSWLLTKKSRGKGRQVTVTQFSCSKQNAKSEDQLTTRPAVPHKSKSSKSIRTSFVCIVIAGKFHEADHWIFQFSADVHRTIFCNKLKSSVLIEFSWTLNVLPCLISITGP